MKTIRAKGRTGIRVGIIVLAGLTVVGLVAALASVAEFRKDFRSGEFQFHVAGENEGGTSRVRVTVSGPGVDPSPVTASVGGTVTWAEITDDLDNDGFPELYIYAACPEDPSSHTGFEGPREPDVVVAVTPRGHGGRIGALVPVAPTANGSAAGVIIGPGVTRRTEAGTVSVLPMVPVDSPAGDDICVNELKFILVKGKKGRKPRLVR
jgi:hypothetical protein